MPKPKSVVYYEAGIISGPKALIKISRGERKGHHPTLDFIFKLAENSPKVVSKDRLITALWGANEPVKDAARALHQIACRARKIGKIVGFKIDTCPDGGYRLL